MRAVLRVRDFDRHGGFEPSVRQRVQHRVRDPVQPIRPILAVVVSHAATRTVCRDSAYTARNRSPVRRATYSRVMGASAAPLGDAIPDQEIERIRSRAAAVADHQDPVARFGYVERRRQADHTRPGVDIADQPGKQARFELFRREAEHLRRRVRGISRSAGGRSPTCNPPPSCPSSPSCAGPRIVMCWK